MDDSNSKDASGIVTEAGDASAEEQMLTISEFIEENEEMVEEAEALLGGIDDESCSYSEGYKSRQPLYSCRTCAEKSGQPAGICLACLHCHDGHDLVEMYTKRKFCCDCGNSRFNDFKCKLFAEKIPINALNSYNHNFNGLYCVCKKPYPPEEGDETFDEAMHQCVVCEDWFHLSHITMAVGEGHAGLEEPEQEANRDEYGEMVCEQCVNRLPFLIAYQMPEALAVGQCKLATFHANPLGLAALKTVLLKQGWRKTLCRCGDCSRLYENGNCTFLLDEEDTMEHYDAKKKENMEKNTAKSGSLESEMYDLALRQTDSHDAALYVYMATKQMQEHLAEFVRSHNQAGISPTVEDVHKCFEELSAKCPKPDEFMASSFQNGQGGDDDSTDPM